MKIYNYIAYDRQSVSESDLQSFLDDSCDTSNNLDFENENRIFNNDFATWAVKHQISHTPLNSLLLTLRKHLCFPKLVVDAQT